MERYRSASYMP